MEARKPLGARLVCMALQQRFPELLERHKDPIASVTTVLNRPAQITPKPAVRWMQNGRRVWEWIGSGSGEERGTAWLDAEPR